MNPSKKNICVYLNLDKIDYRRAWDIQKNFIEKRLKKVIPNVLILLEHPPTITVGKTGKKDNLLVNQEFLKQHHVDFLEVDRGGDITFHGPGQLVGYPILNLSESKPDVIYYLRQLEEVMIKTIAEFKIKSKRRPKYTGVWTDEEKIAAIGIKTSRWVTSHGFALNVHTDLSYFDLIIPCGIRNKNITSMVKCLGKDLSVNDVIPKLVNQFGLIFNFRMIAYNHASWPEINEVLEPAFELV